MLSPGSSDPTHLYAPHTKEEESLRIYEWTGNAELQQRLRTGGKTWNEVTNGLPWRRLWKKSEFPIYQKNRRWSISLEQGPIQCSTLTMNERAGLNIEAKTKAKALGNG